MESWHSRAKTAIFWVKDIVGWLSLTALAEKDTDLVSIKSAHFDEGGCPQGWPSGCLTSCDSPAHSLQLWYFRTLSTNYNTLRLLGQLQQDSATAYEPQHNSVEFRSEWISSPLGGGDIRDILGHVLGACKHWAAHTNSRAIGLEHTFFFLAKCLN